MLRCVFIEKDAHPRDSRRRLMPQECSPRPQLGIVLADCLASCSRSLRHACDVRREYNRLAGTMSARASSRSVLYVKYYFMHKSLASIIT